MMGRCSRPWYSSALRSLLVLTAVLAVCSRAQDMMVNIRLATDRSRTTAIIPSRVEMVYVIGDQDMMVESSSPSNVVTPMCMRTNCTLTLDMMTLVDSVVTINFNSSQTLLLTVRDLDASCREYNVPKMFSNQTDGGGNNLDPYVFRCDPLESLLENSTEVVEVRWRWFRDETEVMMFQSNTSSFEDRLIASGGDFALSGDRDEQLTVRRSTSSEPASIVSYYVPSFVTSAGELATAETLIFLGPEILSLAREFSIEVTFGSEKGEDFRGIECRAETFPPASVSWTLTNTEFPDGIDLTLFDRFGSNIFLSNDSATNFSEARGAFVQMLDLDYGDDGLFTCTVDNQFYSVEQSVRLRVKSPLRPLWPALGIIGVFIIMGIIMLSAFIIEKVVERKKSKFSVGANNADHRHSSVSSAGSANNKGGKRHSHSAVQRRSSSKPLIEESTI